MDESPSTPHRRPRRRRWWLAAAFVAGTAIAGVVAVRWLADVERHRARIEGALSDATGWQVALGDLDLSIWRGLVVTASPVTLTDPDGGARVEIESLVLRADVGPLLRGVLSVRDVELLRPRAEIDLASVAGAGAGEVSRPDEGAERRAPEEAAQAERATVASSVRVDEIRVRGGRVALQGLGPQGARPIELEDVSAVYAPATGRVWGDARVEGGGGRVKWGPDAVGEPIRIWLEACATEVVDAWIGSGWLRAGGTIDGSAVVDPGASVRVELRGRSIGLASGAAPVREARVAGEVDLTRPGWPLAAEGEGEGVAFAVRGELLPAPDLVVEVPEAPAGAVLALARAAAPLPLEIEGEGRAGVTIHTGAGATGEGELPFEARGRLAAGRVLVSGLPPLDDVETSFVLGRDDRLELSPLRARLAGGRYRGRVVVAPAIPPGTARVAGELNGADIGELAALATVPLAGAVAGPVRLDLDVGIDLARGERTPPALTGRMDLSSEALIWSGWRSLLERVDDELDAIRALGRTLGRPDAARLTLAPAGDAPPARVRGGVVFGEAEWRLERFALALERFALEGDARLDPRSGAIDGTFAIVLDPETSARWLAGERWLAPFRDGDRLRLPLEMAGPLDRPRVEIEWADLVRRDAPSLLRGLRELIER